MNKECKVCLIDGIEYLNNKAIKKDITPNQAAQECGCTLEEWIRHMELHVRPFFHSALAQHAGPLVAQFIDKTQIVCDSVVRMESMVKQVHEKVVKEDQSLDLKVLDSYVGLEKALADIVKTLATLQGDLKEATQINIQNNIVQVDKLMAIVMEDAPPELKKKILLKVKNLKTEAKLEEPLVAE